MSNGKRKATASGAESISIQHESGRSFTDQPVGLFIGNEFVPSISGKTFPTYDPATGKEIARVFEADVQDVDAAVSAAKIAFKGWSRTAPLQRGKLLFKLADLIERDIDQLAAIESLDQGKPFNVARDDDLTQIINDIRYFAGFAEKIDGRVINIDTESHVYTRAEPFGVCGQIIPWNFPLMMFAKFAPAVISGNTVVVKTSEKTPLSALKFCQLIVEAEFPAGVINVVSGFGSVAGNALASHMDVRMIAFTGSTATGRRIMTAAAESNLKKVLLELGGKSPAIVFDDANLDAAAIQCTSGYSYNSGQVCCASTRILVQESVHDSFVAKLKDTAKALQIGAAFDEKPDVGPIVDQIQFERVMGFLEAGKKEGARIAYGGHRVRDEGYFISPTIFTDVREDMKIVKEEIFGPVVCVSKFKTMEEAIEMANDTTYGLGASVYTTSLSTAHRMASDIQAGTVWVNCSSMAGSAIPFGGFKQSGVGRDNGIEAIHEYTQIKAVAMKL
ncbi:aldehyde dehydrogenase (NAD(P)(+)) ald5 [Chytriomyces hyalinus]|nr:aldehyde dehydrogenase (NAD(P)(+)) ald5 [Chytriomyces hyalinus]